MVLELISVIIGGSIDEWIANRQKTSVKRDKFPILLLLSLQKNITL